jgi:hypothetical protein
MGELPTEEVPVKTGTVFVVPLPVTVCAAALIASAVMQNANPIILLLCMVLLFVALDCTFVVLFVANQDILPPPPALSRSF